MMIKQHGSVLLVTMVMLVVMTLVGLAGIEVTGLEEKMVLNMRDRQAAFEAAEVALKQAEEYVEKDLMDGSIKGGEDATGLSGFYDANEADGCNQSSTTASLAEKSWEDGCVASLSDNTVFSEAQRKAYKRLVSEPSFIIEKLIDTNTSVNPSLSLGEVKKGGTVYYRITVKAQGLTTASEVRLQTVYRVF